MGFLRCYYGTVERMFNGWPIIGVVRAEIPEYACAEFFLITEFLNDCSQAILTRRLLEILKAERQ
jgi:hypothetical protein